MIDKTIVLARLRLVPAVLKPDLARDADAVDFTEAANVVLRCPFHDPDGRPSVTVDPRRMSWQCFGCGRQGKVTPLDAGGEPEVLDWWWLQSTDRPGALRLAGVQVSRRVSAAHCPFHPDTDRRLFIYRSPRGPHEFNCAVCRAHGRAHLARG